MNNYKDKNFSILGDSISAIDGFVPKNNRVFYKNIKSKKADVWGMQDIWWGIVINQLGGKLLVNDSWSGSCVTEFMVTKYIIPAGCSDKRTNNLHIDCSKPDVIIVYLGNNDWERGIKLYKRHDSDVKSFEGAYELMIRKLKSNYPDSEIWCCTICESYMSMNKKFRFKSKRFGRHCNEFNDVIRSIVSGYNCKLIDLYSYHEPYDSIDGEHPNRSGMKTIANMVIKSI